ncbi:MAG: hypothetical protein JJE04_18715 [Acidobacteriia bacterium]|nr:hypothetical protein [Terriglobia bacterium]
MSNTALRQELERYFQFKELNTNWRTEILASATTFVTMAYIQVYFWNAVID